MLELVVACYAFWVYRSTAALYWLTASVASWCLCGLFTRGRNEELQELLVRSSAQYREPGQVPSRPPSSCVGCAAAGGGDASPGLVAPAHPAIRRSTSGTSLEVFAEVPRCEVNPWVNGTWRVTAAERLKMAALAPWLVPVRVAMLVTAVIFAVIFANLATLGWEGSRAKRALATRERARRNSLLDRSAWWRLRRGETLPLVADTETRSSPRLFRSAREAIVPDDIRMPRWRLALGLPVLACVRVVLCAVGFWRVDVVGRDKISKRARVIVCNHVSMIEPLVLLLHTLATPVTSSDFARLPGLGPVGRLYQLLWLDRGDARSRSAVVEEMTRRATCDEFANEWPPVLVFPEGTTLNGRALISFKPGAFVPGAVVQPVVVRFPHSVRCGMGLDCSWTVAGPQFGELSIRMMLQPWNKVEIRFLDAHAPTFEEKRDPMLFARVVRDEMAAALRAPVTDHSWADMWLNMTARELGEPPHRTLVELGALQAVLGGRQFGREKAAAALRRFATADCEKNGRLSAAQFRAALRGTGDAAARTPSERAPPHEHALSLESGQRPLLASASEQSLLDADAVDKLFALLSRDSGESVDFFAFLVGVALLEADDADSSRGALRLVFSLLDGENDGVVRASRVRTALSGATSDASCSVCDDADAFIAAAPSFEALECAEAEDELQLSFEEFVAFVTPYRDALHRDITQLNTLR